MAGRLSVGAILTLRDEMSAKLDRARGTAKGFVDQIHAGVSHVDKFTSSVSGLGAKMLTHFGESARAMVDKFFSVIKIGAGLAGAALATMVFKGIEGSMGFEAQIRHATGLLVASGATGEQADAAFKQFSSGILAMSPQLAKSPEDLAKSLYLPLSVMAQYGQVNVSVADTLKVVQAASKAATAGFADSTVVTTALSRVLGAYGASADEATHYTDIMQQAVNYGLMTFSDLSTGIGKVAGPAAALSIPFEQVAAAIATITRRGILPDEAFTAFNKFLLAVEKPHPEAIAGLEKMFGPDWQKHFSATALAANGVSGVLDDLMDHVKPTIEQMAALNQATDFGSEEDIRAAGASILGDRVDSLISVIGDVRGLRGVLALTSTAGNTSYAAALGLTGDAVGAVDKQFAEYAKTTQFAKDQFMSFVDVLKESVLGGLLPGIGDRLHEMSAALSEVASAPDFEEAPLTEKLSRIWDVIGPALGGVPSAVASGAATIGAAVWTGIVGWWDEHQDEVKKDINDFFDWLGDTAIPWATDAAIKIGTEFAPALLGAIGAALSSPSGAALAGLALGLKVVVPAVTHGLGQAGSAAAGGESAAAMSGAAAELSGAATALYGAAEALGGAAASESAAAGTMATSGAGLGAVPGMWSAATWVQKLGALSLVVAAGYFTVKTYFDTKGDVNVAQGTHDKSVADNLASGNLSGVAGLLKNEVTEEKNRGVLDDASQDVAGFIFGTDEPMTATRKQIKDYFDRGVEAALASSDPSAGIAKLISDLHSSGIWDQLGKNMQDEITKQITTVQAKFASDTLLEMSNRGFDVSSVYTDPNAGVTGVTRDAQNAITGFATSNPEGFTRAVNDFVSHAVSQQPKVQTTADTLRSMGTALSILNPGLGTFYTNLANMLTGLASWKPPESLLSAPTTANINPGAIGGAIGMYGGEPYLKPPPSTVPPPITRNPHPQAQGGFGTAFSATQFTAGEAGAEDFVFAPHSKGGLAGMLGGAPGVTVHGPLIGHATIREEADIKKVAMALAVELEARSGNANTGVNGRA